jgi:hypothetical protein
MASFAFELRSGCSCRFSSLQMWFALAWNRAWDRRLLLPPQAAASRTTAILALFCAAGASVQT